MSPGPNVIIVALIGYHVAGFAGAGVATTAMCGPTCLLAFFVARTADHNVYAGLITVATAAMAFFTRINPLWMFVVAGVLGLSGWL